jgi:hypothetical protein
MPIVNRITIYRNEDGKFRYSDIESMMLPDEIYDQFKWDKLVRVDVSHVDNQNPDIIVIMSDQLERVETCQYGMYALLDAVRNWDNIFSRGKKEELAVELAKQVKDGTATQVSESGFIHIGEQK